MAWWLVALAGRIAGGVSEAAARAPSALAATALALGVATLAARRFGATAGGLAGLVQASTSWTVMRGRLAEADMLLACLITWTLVAFDRSRGEPEGRRPWRWAFFAGLGLTALAKGIGFGAVMVGASVALIVAWDRDREALRRLRFWPGWALAATVALTWPVLTALRHPSVLGLWTLHVTDRLASRPEHFAGGPWWQYGPALLVQALPWTPLALLGAGPSLVRAFAGRGRGGGDRLLWAWAVAPVVLLSLATVKNAHYAIHALPPWSIWAALGLMQARRAAASTRLDARSGPSGRVDRLRGRRPGHRPGIRHPRPPVRPPRGRVGLLRGRRAPPAAGRAARPALRRLGPRPVSDAVRPRPARPRGPPLLPRPPRLLAARRRVARRPTAGALARGLRRHRPRPRPPRPAPAGPRRDRGPRAGHPVRPHLRVVPHHAGRMGPGRQGRRSQGIAGFPVRADEAADLSYGGRAYASLG